MNDLDKVVEFTERFQQNSDTYLNVALRKEGLPTNRRGGKADIVCLPALYFEVDLNFGEHNKQNLPTYQEFEEIVYNTFSLEPSIVVFSGGGLHIYYLLEDPVVIENEEQRLMADRLLKRLDKIIGKLFEKKGKDYDSVGELSRQLRAPGTLNHKYDTPVEVRAIDHTHQRYTVEELEDVFDHYEDLLDIDHEPVTDTGEVAESPQMSDEEVISRCRQAKNAAKFEKLYDDGNTDDYPSTSEAELALLGIMVFYTQDRDQLDRLMTNSALYRMDGWGRPSRREYSLNKVLGNVKITYQPRQTAEQDFSTEGFTMHYNSEIEQSEIILDRFRLTELGNAERIWHYNKGSIAYTKERGWLFWNGKKWETDALSKIEEVTNKTLRSIYDEAILEADENKSKALKKWAEKCEGRKVRMNSIEDVKPLATVHNDDLDADSHLFNVNNGTINLDSGKLQEHESKNLITRSSPVDYDPDAKCPRFKQFLEEVIVDKNGFSDYEVIRYLQKAIGYSLTSETIEQTIFFLTGKGGNGKSILIESIQNVLGEYSKQTNADTFIKKPFDSGINNDIARLDKARFVAAIESEDGQHLAESLIKQLTGGDTITARFLRKEFFEFRPAFKIFFSTNHKPIIKGSDDGIWRRIAVIPFRVTFDGKSNPKDPYLSEKLSRELPGILNWAIEGYQLWKQEGLKKPKSIMDESEKYRDDMDILKPFLDECCIIDPEEKEEGKTVYYYYNLFCLRNDDFKLTNRKFYRELEHRGFDFKPGTDNVRFLHGLSVHESAKKKLNNAEFLEN
ncbi:putative DNA primase/helicase [Alkalibacillus filiformis]|uniref:DNA primase/helicase n=2 Tax=Alkalibacillus filiformis TaxID=200990 RepID=A0ABU0DVI6_9BACI|nr:putative DNA primase/helicase [Alkalibacillus filiformis]